FPEVSISNLWHIDAVRPSSLDDAPLSEYFSKPYRKNRMVASKETEVLRSAGQVPKQLEKLQDKIKRKLHRTLGEFQRFDISFGTYHLQVTVNKGSLDWKGVNDHRRGHEST